MRVRNETTESESSRTKGGVILLECDDQGLDLFITNNATSRLRLDGGQVAVGQLSVELMNAYITSLQTIPMLSVSEEAGHRLALVSSRICR